MAADMATSLGLDKVKVVNVSFDALVAGQTADFDIALSQVTITDERAKVVDFSTPYFSSDQGVLVNKGTTMSTIDEAKKAKWGVQASTTGQTYLADVVKPDSEAAVLPGHSVDVRGADFEADRRRDARHLDRARPGRAEQRHARGRGAVQHGRGIRRHLPKGSPNVAALDKLLSDYESDGTLEALQTKWLAPVFGGDPSEIPFITP